jgi:hypothetical protein
MRPVARAEQRGAFRLDLCPVCPPDGLPVIFSACFRRFASEPFAGLLRAIAAALPPGRITRC